MKKIGLNPETKRKLALVLQGTKSGPGISIKTLHFSKDPQKQLEEISAFINIVNGHFEGILRLVPSGNFIVPIINNQDAIDVKRRSVSSKVIALACIILFFEFTHNLAPTKAVLEKKLEVTSTSQNQLRQYLSELKNLRWIDEINEGGVIYYKPTTVLKACISLEMLQAIFSELYAESTEVGERELLLQVFPKEYLQLQRNIQSGVKQEDLTKYFKSRGENNGECNTD